MTDDTIAQATRPAATFARARDRLKRHWRIVVLSFLGWTLLAAIPTTSAYLGMGAEGVELWWAMFRKIGLYYYMWGLAAPLLYRLTDALPYRGRGLLIAVPTHLLVLLVLTFIFGFVAHQETWREWLIGPRAIGYHSMSAFTYALIVLCCLAIKFYRLSLLRQREASNARVLAAELDSKLNLARADSLRMQMNPHLLFNALNSIGALIDSSQPDRAYHALEQLADLLRRALRLSQTTEVPLADELNFARAYLALERTRFAERLVVEWQVADEARSLRVPTFVLQPLVENAVKHGVSRSARPVTVTVIAQIADNALEVGVVDDGQTTSAAEGPQLGIANLRERLRLRYGEEAGVESGRTGTGYASVIRIPLNGTVHSP